MSRIKAINKLFFALAVGVIFCLGSYIGVKAAGYSGTVYGRTSWVGYFLGEKDYNLGGAPGDAPYVLPIMSGVLAIPDYIDTPAEFIGMLKTYNLQTGKNKVGSAFIVNTMLGRNAPGNGDTTVSETDWNTLTAILDYLQTKPGGIVWVGSVDNAPLNINSYYQGVGAGSNPNDDAFYTDNKNESGIIFNNGDGTSYRLLRRCANPVGILSGLIPVPVVTPNDFDLNAETTIQDDNNTPGSSISFHHKLTNKGPTKTSKDVSFATLMLRISSATKPNPDQVGAATAEIVDRKNYTATAESTWNGAATVLKDDNSGMIHSINQDDVGNWICGYMVATPASSDHPEDYVKSYECKYISYDWSVSVSSSVDRTVAKPGETINWTHTVKNNGSTATNSNVIYHYQDRGDNGTGTGADNTLASGSAVGATAAFLSTYPVTQADVGKNICRATSASPLSSVNSGWVESSSACVNIPYNWSVSVDSSVDKGSAKPGETVTWTHKVANNGPTATDANVTYRYQDSNGLGVGTGAHHTFASGAAINAISTFSSTYVVTQNDVNMTLCRATGAIPRAIGDGSWITSSAACTFIPYKYTLTPTVTVNPSGVIEDGTSFTIRANINNNGGTVSEPATWDLAESTTKPISNTSLGSAVVPFFKENSDTVVQNIAVTASGEPGKHYCYILSVTPHSSEDPSKISSPQVCVTIGKKPKVQVWGGDLISGGNVTSSTSIKNNFMFGSWVEYGIFSAGLIKGTASGSAFAGESGLSDASICKYSILSFANADNSTCTDSTIKGKYAYSSLGSLSGVAASFPITSLTPLANSNLDNLQGIYKATGGLTISGGNIKKSQWIVINASDENITINGNIAYTNETLKNINEIPQVVIIANNINIADNVTQVDAWLIVKGSLNTCSSIDGTNLAPAAKLDVGMCKQKLMINGPVSAGRLYLRRTAGSGTGTASGDPAEVFNLRADAYLWATARAASDSKIQTVYTTELPPRF